MALQAWLTASLLPLLPLSTTRLTYDLTQLALFHHCQWKARLSIISSELFINYAASRLLHYLIARRYIGQASPKYY